VSRLSAAALTAAERSGANYVLLGNDYGYGPVDGPFTEDLPMHPSSTKGAVRARMWQDALAAHEAGRVRATEVRATDYVGMGATSPFTLMVASPLLAGAPAVYPGDLDAPHSWTYVGDVARTLVAAARHDESWGRAWHVPSTSTASARELATRLAAIAGAPAPSLRRMVPAELEEMGRNNPIMLEFLEILYLYERPAVLDSSLTTNVLEITATPLDQVLQEMIAERTRPTT
jgi:nucleoside-diphosphate-sugar epimerase